MAQDAELKLKVSLDLAFFRQQLSTISTQLGGQALQLDVQFNKKSIADQYRLLDRYLGRKTFKTKIESPTLDALVIKVEKFKENLGKLAGEKISLDVEVASNIDDVRKSIKDKLPAIGIKTELAEPVNVDDFIRDVAKKVDDQVQRSYTAGGVPIATKLTLPGLTDPLKALQKNLNQKDPLRAKLGTVASIKKTDVTALQAAVNEKFKDITVKVRAELDTAATATQGPAAGSSRTFLQELKDLDKAVLQSVYRAAGEDALLAFDEGIINNKTKMIQALSRAAEDASAGFIAALENKKSALFKAAGEYGGALLGGLKKTLKIQSPSREMFDIGDDAGKGFELGLLKAMELAEKSATNQMRRMLDRLARMALMMGGMSAEQINRQVAQARALPGLDFPATVPPRQRIPIGPSSTGRALPAGRAAAGLIGAAQGPAGLLPSMTRQSELTMGLEALVQALVSQSRGRGPEGPGAIVSMESGFIPAMRERFAKAAERYLFGVETQVVDLFDAALRQVESAVDLYIARIQGQISQRMRSAVSVADLGVQGRPILSASRIAGLLPAGVGREPSRYATGAIGGETREQMMARRTAEAYARSALRGMDVMGGGAGRPPSPYSYAYRSARPTSAIVPYAAGGAMVATGAGAGGGRTIPPSGGGGRGGFGGMGGFGGFGRAMGDINLPGAGTIRELGSEFAFATKQVLLFGQAYKMLGFLQDLPGQVGQAASELQSFRNTLNAVVTSAEEASVSNQFILDLVEKFNVPIDSARQGFVKLYASMAPAGFGGEQIRELFTGISKASATLGLSADKVDRVTYAFAQMASKGQLMSEEVTGQLGDVIPGALSIMAEAAGMEIAQFKKAMEDGVFVGEAFTAVMSNVPKVLESRFGKGAEGAANTFQGAMNDVRTSLKLFYESFEPLATQFMAQFVSPLSDRLKELTDGFTAFFTGAAAKTAGGSALAQQLQQLKPSFDGIRQNLQDLLPLLTNLGQVAVNLGKVFIDLAGSPLGGYLIRVYATVLPLVAIIKALNLQAIIPLIASTLRAIPAFVAFNAAKLRLLSTNKALQLSMQLTGSTAAATAGKIRTVGLALGSLVAPAILLGIGALIERFMMLKGAVDGVAQSTKAMLQSISSMANSGAVAELQNVAADTQRQIKTFESLRPFVSGGVLGPAKKLTPEAAQKMQEVGLGGFIGGNILGQQEVKDFVNASKIIEERLKGLRKALASTQEKLPLARRIAADIEAKTKPQDLVPIPKVAAEGAAGKKGKGGRKSLDELVNTEILRLANIEKANIERDKVETEAMAPDTIQAKRMLDYYTDFRNALVDIQAIQGQIQIIEQNRAKYIQLGLTAQELDERTKDLRNELQVATIELATTEQKYRNQAKKDAAEEAKEAAEKIEKQKQLNRLIEDAQIAAGIISPREAAIKLQQREFEDAQARVEAEGSPEQLAQLKAAQALIPEAGSIQETMKTLREELNKLLSAQEMVKFSAASIGEAFSTSFKDAITGAATAQEALAGFFQSVGNAFADMAAQMIQKMIQMYVLDQFLNILPGGGMFKGNASIQGGGFGSFNGGTFGIDAGGSLGQVGQNLSIRPFANGGLVTGPTMGLIGEGRYNEAVVPLPDGKTIPVDLGNAAGNQIVSNITVNVSNGQTQSNANGSNSSELGRKLEGAVKQVIVGELRPGGLLAR